MSTLHVTVENGKLVNEEYCWSEASKQYVEHTEYCTSLCVNNNWSHPWDIMIADSKIVCHCEATYSTGLVEQNRILPLKDGTLILSGGQVGSRYVGFRSKKFSNWLEKNHITQVKKELEKDGSMRITLSSVYCGSGSAAHIMVTDGDVEVLYDSTEDEDYDSSYCGDSTVKYEITGASYVLTYEEMHYNDNHNGVKTLYVKQGFDPLRLGNFFESFPKCLKEDLMSFKCDGRGYYYENVEI